MRASVSARSFARSRTSIAARSGDHAAAKDSGSFSPAIVHSPFISADVQESWIALRTIFFALWLGSGGRGTARLLTMKKFRWLEIVFRRRKSRTKELSKAVNNAAANGPASLVAVGTLLPAGAV